VAELLDWLERDVLGDGEGRRFFGGDAIGYLDIVLGSFLSWLEALRAVAGVALIEAARTPRLAAWAERFGGSEAVRPVAPEVGWVEAYADMLRERWHAEEGISK
jgi:glutathione S-transferase